MATIVMNKKDEFIMKLVHYFITEENYVPIVVNGVKDEIWLENNNGPYRIVRINSNTIFNKEQLDYDYYKIDNIVRQIKKKTFSLKVNTLNILLNVNEDLSLEEEVKNIKDVLLPDSSTTITNKDILEAFPDINDKMLNDSSGVDLIMSVTKDINEKTERENRIYEKTFKPKKIVMTPLLIFICLFVFGVSLFLDGLGALTGVSNVVGLLLGANYMPLVLNGQVWRLVTCIFVHWSLLHLFVNMYSLYILGTQMETFIGKWKFLILFIGSGICGSLLSLVVSGGNVISGGASGAIFGLLGALLYFGYHYRNYLGNAIRSQIIPIILINLGIGFISGLNIDNACHIGGLLGGYLLMMALGVSGKSPKGDKINGRICLGIYTVFCIYMIFFR